MKLFCALCLVLTLSSQFSGAENDCQLYANDHGVRNDSYLRLPSSVIPLHYDLAVQPFFTNFTYKGRVAILLSVKMETSNVTLHAGSSLDIPEGSVKLKSVNKGKKGDVPKIDCVSRDAEKDFLVIHLHEKLKSGRRYRLKLEFTGILNDDLVGFYRSSYIDSQGVKRWLATTYCEPTQARRAIPCFDEPAMKASYSITLLRTRNKHSLSNMPLVKTEDIGDGWFADHFEQTPPMHTYSLSMIVSDFKNKKGPGKVSVWSRANQINHTSYALTMAQKHLDFYENLFGIKYPLPKLGHIAIPDFPTGATENWGMVPYQEVALYYDPRYRTTDNQLITCIIPAHETSHMWFGNLVTLKWWNNLWINEGFASYWEIIAVRAAEPDWRMDEYKIKELHGVMTEEDNATRVISKPVETPRDIKSLFKDDISYKKAAFVIRMVQYFLGTETFMRGVKDYLNTHKYKTAEQDDIFAAWTNAQASRNRIDVKKVLEPWFSQVLYPVVTVERKYTTGTATLEQNVYANEDVIPHLKNSNMTWPIPITYTDSKSLDFEPKTKFWLMNKTGRIENVPDGWIILNLQEVGYYRVNYDTTNWQVLRTQLLVDHEAIHVINRAQLIDDSFHLAKIGLLTYIEAFDVSLYLKYEQHYVAWNAFFLSQGYVGSMIHHENYYQIYKEYMISLMEPIYRRLGWDNASDKMLQNRMLRTLVLEQLCLLGYEPCIETAKAIYEEWTKDAANLNIIHPDLRYVVYCTAVQTMGPKAFDFILENWKSAETIAPGIRYIKNALACIKTPSKQEKYLESTITNGTSTYGDIKSLKEICIQLYKEKKDFHFLKQHWKDILEIFKVDAIIDLLRNAIGYYMNTEQELEQFEKFCKEHEKDLEPYNTEIIDIKRKIKHNIKWMRRHSNDIAQFLHNYKLSHHS